MRFNKFSRDSQAKTVAFGTATDKRGKKLLSDCCRNTGPVVGSNTIRAARKRGDKTRARAGKVEPVEVLNHAGRGFEAPEMTDESPSQSVIIFGRLHPAHFEQQRLRHLLHAKRGFAVKRLVKSGIKPAPDRNRRDQRSGRNPPENPGSQGCGFKPAKKAQRVASTSRQLRISF